MGTPCQSWTPLKNFLDPRMRLTSNLVAAELPLVPSMLPLKCFETALFDCVDRENKCNNNRYKRLKIITGEWLVSNCLRRSIRISCHLFWDKFTVYFHARDLDRINYPASIVPGHHRPASKTPFAVGPMVVRFPASTQCRTTIGPPAKRHLNGVSLEGQWWPAFRFLPG